ncbi:MAG: clostripain-related cysteine peptidase [Thermoplasmata archaeon]
MKAHPTFWLVFVVIGILTIGSLSSAVANNNSGSRQSSANDAGSGRDAGSTLSAAVQISGPRNTYTGSLSASDTKDVFKISLQTGDLLKVNLTVPSGANYDLEIGNTGGTTQVKSNTYNTYEECWYRADRAGAYPIKIVRVSGEGQYSFSVNVVNVPLAKWTIMFYMSADDEIDSSVDSDLSQLRQLSYSSNFHVITLTDKSKNGDTKCYKLRNGGMDEIPLKVINCSWGSELDMSNIQNLISFTKFVFQVYPSTYKMLVFWSHSRGGLTVGYDPDRGDNIDFQEITQALTKIKSNNKGQKLDIIGYDACWSHNIATAYQISPYAKYMVGPESTSAGWQYSALSYVANNPSVTPAQLAAYLGNNIASYKIEASGAFDLSKINTLMTAVKSLAVKLKSVADNQTAKIWAARNATQEYDPDYDAPYIDLYDFCEKLAIQFPTPDWTTILNSVKSALNSSLVGSENYGAYGSHGLGIMFPKKAAKYSGYEYTFKKGKFTTDTQWDEFLSAFYY